MLSDDGPTVWASLLVLVGEPLREAAVAVRVPAAHGVGLVHEAVADLARDQVAHGLEVGVQGLEGGFVVALAGVRARDRGGALAVVDGLGGGVGGHVGGCWRRFTGTGDLQALTRAGLGICGVCVVHAVGRVKLLDISSRWISS